MAWMQTANKADVEQNSGLYGWERMFHQRVPGIFRSDSGGNGSIVSGDMGTTLDSGADSGANDYARLFKPQRAPGGKQVVDEVTTIVNFKLDTNPNWTDNGRVGECPNSPGSTTKGAFLDFAAGAVNVNGTTKAVNLTATNRPAYIMRIRIDYVAGETEFRIVGDAGNTDETVTIADTIGPMDCLAAVQENGGGGSSFKIRYARSAVTAINW